MALQKTLNARDSGASINYHVITQVQGIKNLESNVYTIKFLLHSYTNVDNRVAGKSFLDVRAYSIPATQEQIDNGIKLSELYDYVKANDQDFSNAIDV